MKRAFQLKHSIRKSIHAYIASVHSVRIILKTAFPVILFTCIILSFYVLDVALPHNDAYPGFVGLIVLIYLRLGAGAGARIPKTREVVEIQRKTRRNYGERDRTLLSISSVTSKPLLRLKYSFLENPVGFVWKHITYHYFMQNFAMLGLAVYRPHVFEIW